MIEYTAQDLIDHGFAQVSSKGHHVARVSPEQYGEKAWFHARMNPTQIFTLSREMMREFKALGGPTAAPGWDGRPPRKSEPVPNQSESPPTLREMLIAAKDHLEWTGYGDKYERECAREDRLEEKIQAALDAPDPVLASLDEILHWFNGYPEMVPNLSHPPHAQRFYDAIERAKSASAAAHAREG